MYGASYHTRLYPNGANPSVYANTSVDKAFPLTFCFHTYAGTTSFSCMNWGTYMLSGKYIHCETYDAQTRLSAYITSDSQIFNEAIRTYTSPPYDFITVYLTRVQWEKYRLVVEKHKGNTRFSTCSLFCYPFSCCCDCSTDTSRTCSDINAEMINELWPEYRLPRPTHEYTPTDIYHALVQLTSIKGVPCEMRSANPSPP